MSQAITRPALVTVSVRCQRCNLQRLPHEIAYGDQMRGYWCLKCLEKHYQMLDDLARRRPRECSDCGLSFAQMDERGQVSELKLFEKDGWLALFCSKCYEKYMAKTHQIRGTLYERLAKIR